MAKASIGQLRNAITVLHKLRSQRHGTQHIRHVFLSSYSGETWSICHHCRYLSGFGSVVCTLPPDTLS